MLRWLACTLPAAALLAPASAVARPVDGTARSEVRDPLAALTPRQLAGQRIVVGWAGPRVPAWLLARVRRGEVGGVIAFTRNVRRQGRLTAANLRRAGINVHLAPVAGLGRPGSHQARTGRAFARSPRAVVALATAFASGLQGRGVAATLFRTGS